MIRVSKASIGLALAGICALGLGNPANAQNLLTNGGFENLNNTYAGGGFMTVGAGDNTTITGWNVSSGSVDWIGNYWQAHEGSYSIDLSGNSAGALELSTEINTVANKYYQVSFWMSGNPDNLPTTKDMKVTFANTVYNVQYVGGTQTRANMNWTQAYFYAQATSTTSQLKFESLTANAFGPALDDVSVTAVPEVGGMVNMCAALMGPGMGLLAMRRARRNKAASVA